MQGREFKSFLAGLAVMTITASASAQTTYYPAQTTYYQTVVVQNPSHFKVGNHHYDFNVSGLREYVDSLKKKEPKLFARMDKKLSELETARNTGLVIIAGGAIGGGVLMTIGVLKSVDSSRSSAQSTGTADTSIHPTFFIGAILLAASPLGILAMPSRSDYLRFINEHNDMDPPSPITLQFGFAPAPGGGQGWLTATF
jgi:pterin-4a-carbinolamine dehydratase